MIPKTKTPEVKETTYDLAGAFDILFRFRYIKSLELAWSDNDILRLIRNRNEVTISVDVLSIYYISFKQTEYTIANGGKLIVRQKNQKSY